MLLPRLLIPESRCHQLRRPWVLRPLVSWTLRLLPPLPDCFFEWMGSPRKLRC